VSRLGGLASFVVASTLGLLAFAEDQPNARLSWVRSSGAESCVDEAALKKAVVARLGRDAFAGAVSIEIDGTVAREPKRWIAKLKMRDEKGAPFGERELTSEADTCASLSEAVTLAIALAIDPDASSASASASAPASAPASASSASASASASSSASAGVVNGPLAGARGSGVGGSSPASVPPPGAALFVRALLSTSLLPKPAPGLAVSFEPVFAHSFRAAFGATYFPPQKTADGIASISMTTLNGGICTATTGSYTVGADLCASLHGGATHAAVHLLEPDQPGDRFWLGASAGVRFRVNLSGFLLEAIADAWVPLTRHRFRITGMAPEDSIFRQGPGLVAGIGLGWNRF
jgi:hypothetical protein